VQAAPSWVTLIVVPATVSCAVRGVVDGLAVTEKETVAFPVPFDTAGVNHEASSETCHVQPALVLTVTEPEPAPDPTVKVVGVTV
jgi:hypothetical protein